MWAGAGQAESTLTAHVRGTGGGGGAGGDTAASLETRLTGRHRDSGSGRLLLQRKVFFYKVVLCESFTATHLKEHGFRPSECFLVVVCIIPYK